MKRLIDEMCSQIPPKVTGYKYIKTQNIFIPCYKLTFECLVKKVTPLNLFFESILGLVDITVKDIDAISRILGISHRMTEEAIVDMVADDYISISEGVLELTPAGKKALETRKKVEIQKHFLNDIILDAITGKMYDVATKRLVIPGKREVLFEETVSIDAKYIASHFSEINAMYQSQLRDNNVFGEAVITSEIYKIIGVSYSQLHYSTNKVYVYKADSSDEVYFEFQSDENECYKRAFYEQLKDTCRPCQEYFFEKNRPYTNDVTQKALLVNSDLMAQTEKVREVLLSDRSLEDKKDLAFKGKRYALYDTEYISYLNHAKATGFDCIIVCSNNLDRNFLSHKFCDQVMSLAESIPIYILYRESECGVDKSIDFFFKKSKQHVHLIPCSRVAEEAICFGSKVIVCFYENLITAFERPIRCMLPMCSFDEGEVDEFRNSLKTIMDKQG